MEKERKKHLHGALWEKPDVRFFSVGTVYCRLLTKSSSNMNCLLLVTVAITCMNLVHENGSLKVIS